jgi:hypothetical protein
MRKGQKNSINLQSPWDRPSNQTSCSRIREAWVQGPAHELFSPSLLQPQNQNQYNQKKKEPPPQTPRHKLSSLLLSRVTPQCLAIVTHVLIIPSLPKSRVLLSTSILILHILNIVMFCHIHFRRLLSSYILLPVMTHYICAVRNFYFHRAFSCAVHRLLLSVHMFPDRGLGPLNQFSFLPAFSPYKV